MTEISILRRNLLRACYGLLVVGLAVNFWPMLLRGLDAPLMEGAVTALISAIGVLAILGLFSPLRMLPLLLFEIVWKLLWVLSVAVPHWLAGSFDASLGATLFACAWAVPFALIMPWRYVFTTYGRQAEPWH